MGVELGAFSYSVGHTNQFNGRVVVGKYTSIAIGCVFLCGDVAMHASAGTQYVSNYRWQFVDRGDITIGNDVWIGTNVIVLAGVTIGDGAIVGAGCVVSKDVPPYAVVVGNPQQIKRYRFAPEVIEGLLTIRWWDWLADRIEQEVKQPEFHDAAKFVEKFLPAVRENQVAAKQESD